MVSISTNITVEELERLSTQQLVEVGQEHPLLYEAEQECFKRWRNNKDLDVLIALIISEDPSERSFGAYYLCEVSGRPIDELLAPALTLASSNSPYDRYSFLSFVLGNYFDETIGSHISRLLDDVDTWVRYNTIFYAIYLTRIDFEKLCEVSARDSETPDSLPPFDKVRDRRLRALDIAHYIRTGRTIEDVENLVRFEDSFTFENLQRQKSLIDRRLERMSQRGLI